MGLRRARIRNFQSLRSVDLEIEKLTVIVGPSSSGKSAFLRALRVLAYNVRGSSFVTRGEKVAAVSVETTDNQTVTIERGEGVSTYKVDDQTYTKSGTSVPEAVSKVLRFDTSESSLNFAGQFDRPYLLDESGAAVARVLGELTNVSRLFEAAREANRRRLRVSEELKVRERDREQLMEKAALFRDLPARLAVMQEAEQYLETAEGTASRVARLRPMVERLELSESVLQRLQGTLPEAPDYAPVEEAHSRYARYRSLMAELSNAAAAANEAARRIEEAAAQESAAHDQIHELLREAGTCPTCGQTTSHLTSV